MAECEQDVSDDVQGHSGADQMDQVAFVDEPTGHDAVENQSCGNQCIEPAGTPDAEFLGVKRNVVRDGTIGESNEDEVDELRNGTGEEESVKRKRWMWLFLLGGNFQCLHQNESDDTQGNRNHEYDGVAEGFVQEHACHGACRKREVHADAEVTDAFATAACG